MYIVLEYYLLENFIINLIILLITRYISKSEGKLNRIYLGTVISTVYSLVFFYPPLLFLTKYSMKILISLIIVKISFNAKEVKPFTRQILIFYIVSFVLAGLITSLSWDSKITYLIIGEKKVLENIYGFKYLIIGMLLGVILIYIVFMNNFKISIRDKYVFNVDIHFKKNTVNLKALVDTGNILVEPLSKKPVFVVEYKELKGFLSKGLQEVYDNKQEDNYEIIEEKWNELNSDIKLIVIPFKSLGSKGDIIFGFKPDYIQIHTNDSELIRNDVIIGIYNGKLINDEGYSGLLSHELMIGGNNIEEVKI